MLTRVDKKSSRSGQAQVFTLCCPLMRAPTPVVAHGPCRLADMIPVGAVPADGFDAGMSSRGRRSAACVGRLVRPGPHGLSEWRAPCRSHRVVRPESLRREFPLASGEESPDVDIHSMAGQRRIPSPGCSPGAAPRDQDLQGLLLALAVRDDTPCIALLPRPARSERAHPSAHPSGRGHLRARGPSRSKPAAGGAATSTSWGSGTTQGIWCPGLVADAVSSQAALAADRLRGRPSAADRLRGRPSPTSAR